MLHAGIDGVKLIHSPGVWGLATGTLNAAFLH